MFIEYKINTIRERSNNTLVDVTFFEGEFEDVVVDMGLDGKQSENQFVRKNILCKKQFRFDAKTPQSKIIRFLNNRLDEMKGDKKILPDQKNEKPEKRTLESLR